MVNQMWTDLGRGRRDPKNSQICADILYGWPFSNLVKKTDYNTKITEIENKINTDYDHDKFINT